MVRAEALPIFFSSNDFVIGVACGNERKMASNWLRSMGDSSRALMKQVMVHAQECDSMLNMLQLFHEDQWQDSDSFVPHAEYAEKKQINGTDYRVIPLDRVDFDAELKDWAISPRRSSGC